MSRTSGRTDEGRGRLGSVLSGLAVALGRVLFLGGFAWGAIEYQPYTGADRVDGADHQGGRSHSGPADRRR